MRLISRVSHAAISAIFVCLLIALSLTLLAPLLWDLDLRAVASGSMEPAIKTGSMVVIKPVAFNTILPGDIISFQGLEPPGSVVTHRVVEVTSMGDERVFRTKGDANQDNDLTLVSETRFMGRVILHLPYFGNLSQFIRTRQGWILIVIFPAMILVVTEMINILKIIWSKDAPPGAEAGRAKPKMGSRIPKKPSL